MSQPDFPKIYHIVHVDRLPSILADKFLWSDATMSRRTNSGTVIGMTRIKERRLNLKIDCHSELSVGECVPFYFCPRSVMLYLLHKGNNSDLAYAGGQSKIIHIEADLYATVNWAEQNSKRWAFTLSNAGANYFESRNRLDQLHEINWNAVQSTEWCASPIKEGKQAEFLVEQRFPWHLVSRIGVQSEVTENQVIKHLQRSSHRPAVEIQRAWYY
jgi:hypothetical protein